MLHLKGGLVADGHGPQLPESPGEDPQSGDGCGAVACPQDCSQRDPGSQILHDQETRFRIAGPQARSQARIQLAEELKGGAFGVDLNEDRCESLQDYLAAF